MINERKFGRVIKNKRLLIEIEETFKNDYLPSIRRSVTSSTLNKLLRIHETIKQQIERVNDYIVIPERRSLICFLTVNVIAYYELKNSFRGIPYNEYRGLMEVLIEEMELNTHQSIQQLLGFF